MAKDENYPEGVFRQRRNFLLASAVLAAFLFLDIEFSEIQVFGIKFLLRNKENLLWIVFAWWCYLFWRYYQYHREIHDGAIGQDYSKIVYAIASPIVASQAKKSFPDATHPQHANYTELQPINWVRSQFNGRLLFPGPNPGQIDYREASFEVSRLRFIPAHIWAFLRVLFANHRVSDFLLPYAIAIVLAVTFFAKVNSGA